MDKEQQTIFAPRSSRGNGWIVAVSRTGYPIHEFRVTNGSRYVHVFDGREVGRAETLPGAYPLLEGLYLSRIKSNSVGHKFAS